MSDVATNPHLAEPLQVVGPVPSASDVVVVAVHGRAQDPEYMRQYLIDRIARPDVPYRLPAAHGGSWYPQSFMAPTEANEPQLSWALARLDAIADDLVAEGIADDHIVWVGFSQGACLVAEWVARHPRRWGGLAILTGGLIGPPDTELLHDGDLSGTPVFLGSSDVDEWVPERRVQESAEALRAQGGAVEVRIYPGMGHEINDDEIEAVRAMIASASPT